MPLNKGDILFISSQNFQPIQNKYALTLLVTTEAATRGVLRKKGFLRNFAIFTGKHLCRSLFFNKLTGLRPAILLKKRLWHRCFPVNFGKFLRTSFLHRTAPDDCFCLFCSVLEKFTSMRLSRTILK